jgi:hypothetical protein
MRVAAILLLLVSASPLMAYESAFPPTKPGTSELKTLPAGTLLKAAAGGDYFARSGGLFRPLFNYISTHDIKMTVPVEAQIDDAAMYFWVGRTELDKVRPAGGGVEIIRVSERRVAARGARGGYNRQNFERTRDELLRWVETQGALVATGPAYAVYWNGPFTPWFLREYEVHVPVRPKD